MKPGRLLIGTYIFLFTAAYSTPAAGYTGMETAAINYRAGIYVKKDSLQTAAHYEQRAHDLFNRKLYKRAIVQWKKVLQLQPGNAFALFMLGKSYMNTGRKEKGEALCDEAIACSCD
jgi:cytochrome c-type biogenesis protein CcmH/NrfG